MREILFRGKDIVGNWHYGDFEYYTDDFVKIVNHSQQEHGKKVERETIGQYTGLTDKNGKKIFEGDIVKEEDCVHNGEVQIYGRKWVVYFDKGVFFGWRKGYKSCGLSKFIPNISGIEIIGNIHDNPELLKEAEQE